MELSRKSGKTLYTVLYFCFLASFTLLACEGIVRVYSRFFFPKMMLIDPPLGWYHAKNLKKYFPIETGEKVLNVQNGLGHRGPDHGPHKAAGKKRVLVLGDSFTEGSHVNEDELFTNIIAQNYPDLEMMNAGIGAYSSVQEYLYLRNHGLDTNPDLVLLMFSENDIWENCLSFYPSFGPRPYASIQNGELVINEKPTATEYLKYAMPAPFAEKLNQFSLAYNFLNSRLYQPMRFAYLQKLESEDVKKTEAYPRQEIANKVLQKMRALLEERGILFAVGFVPSREDTMKGSSDLQTALLSFCDKSGIPFFSTIQPMKESYDKGVKAYFDVDIHWNRNGHKVASEVVGPFIHDLLAKSGRQ